MGELLARPQRLQPMVAVSGALPRDQARWSFEVKWDGVRALAYISGGTVTLESRNQADITGRYPELAGLGAALGKDRAVVLDGEVVAFDDTGRPSFERLQTRMHLTGEAEVRRRMATTPIAYLLFDVLWIDGEWTIDRPLKERRQLLDQLMAGTTGAWQISPSHPGEGDALLEATKQQGLEGIIAKRLDSPYEPGRRSPLWIKIKNFLRQEFVIGGWVPGGGGRTGRIGALMLGYYDDRGVLHYAGKVGTGFTGAELDRLAGLFGPLARADTPFAEQVPDWRVARYIDPVLVAEVAYGHWTAAGQVRHSSYQGLRDDKPATDVRRS
jgi:bifunctional non-homologous end joining protein LigD